MRSSSKSLCVLAAVAFAFPAGAGSLAVAADAHGDRPAALADKSPQAPSAAAPNADLRQGDSVVNDLNEAAAAIERVADDVPDAAGDAAPKDNDGPGRQGSEAQQPGGQAPANARSADPAGDEGVSITQGKRPLEKAAFLGISTSPLPPRTEAEADGTNQWPAGVGLRIDNVMPDTPAATAGLRSGDSLTRVDDQWVVNPQQLTVLVRMHKPDDEVTLTIFRDGVMQLLKAKLAMKMLPPVGTEPPQPGMAGGNVMILPMPNNLPPGVVLPPGVALPPGLIAPGQAGGMIQIQPGQGAATMCTMSHSDAEHDITLTIKNGASSAVVKDKAGKMLFDGPIDTPKQREAIPKNVVGKIEALEKGAMKFDVMPGQREQNPAEGPNADTQ